MAVEAGPKPVSPLPWEYTRDESDGEHSGCGMLWGPDGSPVGGIGDTCLWHDSAAIVHRVNNWDALIAERDAAMKELNDFKRETLSAHRLGDQIVSCVHAEALRDQVLVERDALAEKLRRVEALVGKWPLDSAKIDLIRALRGEGGT